jgi:hypothetical protein
VLGSDRKWTVPVWAVLKYRVHTSQKTCYLLITKTNCLTPFSGVVAVYRKKHGEHKNNTVRETQKCPVLKNMLHRGARGLGNLTQVSFVLSNSVHWQQCVIKNQPNTQITVYSLYQSVLVLPHVSVCSPSPERYTAYHYIKRSNVVWRMWHEVTVNTPKCCRRSATDWHTLYTAICAVGWFLMINLTHVFSFL